VPALTPISVGDAATPNGWDAATNGDLGDNSDATFGEVTTNADGAYDQGWLLDDVDADFGTMDDLAVVLRYAWSATPTNTVWEEPAAGAGTDGLQVRIVNGATILAAADGGGGFETVVENPTATSPTNSGSTGFTFVNTTANKATWDGATVEIRIHRNRNKGGGSEGQRVHEADFTGNYTIASAAVYPPFPRSRGRRVRM
jgi:hypothetical protein